MKQKVSVSTLTSAIKKGIKNARGEIKWSVHNFHGAVESAFR